MKKIILSPLIFLAINCLHVHAEEEKMFFGEFTSVPVVEEFTGTWCGWCPIGYDGMEDTKEQYGDKVILIAVHVGDVMETEDYAPVSGKATSYPSSNINRSISTYPNASMLKYYIDQSLANVPIGCIAASARWTDEEMSEIKAETKTIFSNDISEGKFGIAFVLVEDEMTGTTSGWAQANYLSGNSSYASSYPYWYNSPSKVVGLDFNHVAVASWGIADGIDSSVSSVIKAGEIQTFSYTADIKSNQLIQDKSKLSLVAMLINQETGNIVNASKTSISDYESTIIGDVNGDESITMADANMIVNAFLGGQNLELKKADVNGDGQITMADANQVVNMFLDNK